MWVHLLTTLMVILSIGGERVSQFSNGFDLQMTIKKQSVKMGVDKTINPPHGLFKRRIIRKQNFFSLN